VKTLVQVSSAVLETIRSQVKSGGLRLPLSRSGLVGVGIRHQEDLLVQTFEGLDAKGCVTTIDAVLSERAHQASAPELVWTGPEGACLVARDTSVVLRSLFESAQESVVVAGYRFDHPEEVLRPLHATMKARKVSVRLFIDIDQIPNKDVSPESHLAEHCGRFFMENWPFGEPLPKLFYDRRAITAPPPFCSMHAKCVVVDGKRAFVSSANFTDRGQERNIEVGVLINDPRFAMKLAQQWDGLVKDGIVGEYRMEH
jgi:PLD-like domain